MTTIHDSRLGELTLSDGEYRTTIDHAGRRIPFSIEINDADALPAPVNLLPISLDEILVKAIARVRSEDEHRVGEYIAHQLDQIEQDEWKKVLPEGADATADTVREVLSLRSIWGTYDEDGLSLHLDYGLPASLTDYVIAVRIDATGEIEDISMES